MSDYLRNILRRGAGMPAPIRVRPVPVPHLLSERDAGIPFDQPGPPAQETESAVEPVQGHSSPSQPEPSRPPAAAPALTRNLEPPRGPSTSPEAVTGPRLSQARVRSQPPAERRSELRVQSPDQVPQAQAMPSTGPETFVVGRWLAPRAEPAPAPVPVDPTPVAGHPVESQDAFIGASPASSDEIRGRGGVHPTTVSRLPSPASARPGAVADRPTGAFAVSTSQAHETPPGGTPAPVTTPDTVEVTIDRLEVRLSEQPKRASREARRPRGFADMALARHHLDRTMW